MHDLSFVGFYPRTFEQLRPFVLLCDSSINRKCLIIKPEAELQCTYIRRLGTDRLFYAMRS